MARWGVIVRAATAADVPAVERLVNSAYRGESSRAGWTTEADLLDGQRVDVEGLGEILARPENVLLLAERDDGLIGCVHLQRQGARSHLGMLTIRPTAQTEGLGSRLLSAAERWAIDHWASLSMQMTVIAQRAELIAWYARRGYRPIGERRPFPYGDPRFGLPKREDLVFEVLEKRL